MIIGKYYYIEYIEDLDIDEDIPVSMTIESEEEFFQNLKTFDRLKYNHALQQFPDRRHLLRISFAI